MGEGSLFFLNFVILFSHWERVDFKVIISSINCPEGDTPSRSLVKDVEPFVEETWILWLATVCNETITGLFLLSEAILVQVIVQLDCILISGEQDLLGDSETLFLLPMVYESAEKVLDFKDSEVAKGLHQNQVYFFKSRMRWRLEDATAEADAVVHARVLHSIRLQDVTDT